MSSREWRKRLMSMVVIYFVMMSLLIAFEMREAHQAGEPLWITLLNVARVWELWVQWAAFITLINIWNILPERVTGKSLRERLPVEIALFTMSSLLWIVYYAAFDAHLHRRESGEALWRWPESWAYLVGFVAIIMCFRLFVLPFWEKRRVARKQILCPGQYRRNRIHMTIVILLFILVTAVFQYSGGLDTFTIDRWAFWGMLWLAALFWLIQLWVTRPTPEIVEMLDEGGDVAVSLRKANLIDERNITIVGKASARALGWIFGIIFIAGSIYDIFITNMWPARTLAEVLLIVILYFTAYARIERGM